MRFYRLMSLSFLMAFVSMVGNAQSKTLYASFSYIKINPGKNSAYLNNLNNYSPKITEARIRQGGVLGWYIYQVSVPSGSANAYDMVSITVVDDFKLLFDELAPPDDLMKKIFPGVSDQSVAKIFEEWESTRVVVKKDIYTVVSDLVPGSPSFRYAMVDYVTVAEGMESAHIKFETETLGNFYRDQLKTKAISNRKIYQRNVPLEAADFISICQTDDISNFVQSPADKAASTFDGSKVKKVPVGKTLHREIWELVQYVDQSTIKKP